MATIAMALNLSTRAKRDDATMVWNEVRYFHSLGIGASTAMVNRGLFVGCVPYDTHMSQKDRFTAERMTHQPGPAYSKMPARITPSSPPSITTASRCGQPPTATCRWSNNRQPDATSLVHSVMPYANTTSTSGCIFRTATGRTPITHRPGTRSIQTTRLMILKHRPRHIICQPIGK